jgi:hypothetical protein
VNVIACDVAPPAVVTTIVFAPAVPIGVTAVIEVALTTTTLVAATPPIVTLVAPVKFVPVIVIAVLPVVGPTSGLTLAMVGAGTTYVNALGNDPVPAAVVTATLCAPAVPAGVTAVIEVALATTTLVAGTPPTVTLLAPVKFVPVIVKAVPPNVVPVVGAMLVMVGAGTTYVNALGNDAVPAAVVTATLCAPAVPAGVTAVIEVALATTTLVAGTPPTVTLLAPVKFVPVMVKAVPPNVVPVVGEMLVMVGAGTTYVNALGNDAVPPTVVTTTFCAPAVPAGVAAVNEVPEPFTTTLVAVAPPTVTAAPVKFVPTTVMVVPPKVVPVVGDTLARVGVDEAMYVNAPVLVTLPLIVFTTTSFKPAVPAGVTAVICDSNLLVMLANEPPISTLVAPSKFVPVIVIVVPPLVDPVAGLTDAIVGDGITYVNAPVLVTDPPPGVVTTTSFKPALAKEVLAVICVPAPLTTALTTATPPTVIVELVAPVKFVPTIVIAVPPLVGPVAGLTLVMVGIAA